MKYLRSIVIVAVITIFGGLSLSVSAAAQSLSFQSFSTNTGDWAPPGTTFRVPSGGGTLHLTAPAGDHYYAEVHNIDDDYIPGYYGDSGFSLFGYATQPPYTGDFSQSIKMYVSASWPVALYGMPGVWIDETPGSPSGNYGGEHNFRLTPTGSSVIVTADGQTTPIVTISTSGWYNFQMTFRKGATGTDLVTTNMNVFDPNGNLVGTTSVVADSPGGPLLSKDLLGPGYVWITVWPDGWAGDVLGIDDVRADLLTACDGYGTTSKGDITVSSGQTCLLNGSTVSGNVTQIGGSLIVNNTKIAGNLQVTGGGTFSTSGSTVNGNFQIQNLPASAGMSQVCGTIVKGNLDVHNNGAAVMIGSSGHPCASNTVGGNLNVDNNTAEELVIGNTVGVNLQVQNNTGLTEVIHNTVSQNLTCMNNTNLPVLDSGPNTAHQKQGQCH